MASSALKLPKRLPGLSARHPDPIFSTSDGKAFVSVTGLLSSPILRPIRKAAIVSCGGLCPGINTVLCGLAEHLQALGAQVFGVLDGYRGFYESVVPWKWTEEHRHTGGSLLRCSRGGWDLPKIKSGILSSEFDTVFVIGGDGTHRGIAALIEALPDSIAVVGLPKTIDNDVYGFDQCFGFDSAVDAGRRAIESAFTEASSVDMGVGLVKLMGRHSGHIALAASVAFGSVDVCLIPEVPAKLPKVLNYTKQVLSRRRKCVLVVAEGCNLSDTRLLSPGVDASGNPLLPDVGQLLQYEIKTALSAENPVLKYIDPSYQLRGCAPVTSDLRLCSELSLGAVLGCLAGYSGFSVGRVAGQTALVPISHIVFDEKGKYRSRKPIVQAERLLHWHFRQTDLG